MWMFLSATVRISQCLNNSCHSFRSIVAVCTDPSHLPHCTTKRVSTFPLIYSQQRPKLVTVLCLLEISCETITFALNYLGWLIVSTHSQYPNMRTFRVTIQWKPTWCTIYPQFISSLNIYMFQAYLLPIIRRYHCICTAIGMCYMF
jgi:hypothetical protein